MKFYIKPDLWLQKMRAELWMRTYTHMLGYAAGQQNPELFADGAVQKFDERHVDPDEPTATERKPAPTETGTWCHTCQKFVEDTHYKTGHLTQPEVPMMRKASPHALEEALKIADELPDTEHSELKVLAVEYRRLRQAVSNVIENMDERMKPGVFTNRIDAERWLRWLRSGFDPLVAVQRPREG